MTAAVRASIASPATSLLVYQTDGTPGFYYNAGTPATRNWLPLSISLAGVPVGTTDIQTLTNKTLIDNSTYVADDLDNTKKMQLQVSGVTSGTTRTLTVPDANTTLVGTDASQALTNKDLTGNTNNVLSRGLWANSGSGSVSTYASLVPTANQVLTATSANAATWQMPGVTAYHNEGRSAFSLGTGNSGVMPETITPAAGTYIAMLSATLHLTGSTPTQTTALSSAEFDISFGGNDVGQGNVLVDASVPCTMSVYTQAIVTVNGTQSVTGNFFCASGGPMNVLSRSLILVRVQ